MALATGSAGEAAAMQHLLCFLPLPQGQGSFLPILAIAQGSSIVRRHERDKFLVDGAFFGRGGGAPCVSLRPLRGRSSHLRAM